MSYVISDQSSELQLQPDAFFTMRPIERIHDDGLVWEYVCQCGERGTFLGEFSHGRVDDGHEDVDLLHRHRLSYRFERRYTCAGQFKKGAK